MRRPCFFPDGFNDMPYGEEVRVIVQPRDHIELLVQPVECRPVTVEAAPGHAGLALPAQHLCRAARPGLGAEE